jgi:hypothetical protein
VGTACRVSQQKGTRFSLYGAHFSPQLSTEIGLWKEVYSLVNASGFAASISHRIPQNRVKYACGKFSPICQGLYWNGRRQDLKTQTEVAKAHIGDAKDIFIPYQYHDICFFPIVNERRRWSINSIHPE